MKKTASGWIGLSPRDFVEPPTTPDSVNEDVGRLVDKLPGSGEPEFVAVRPSLASVLGECYDNVERQVAENGGTAQLGWTIRVRPGRLIEAEFHSVWRQEDGVLVDVTPHANNGTEIMFVPDDVTILEPRKSNVLLALSDDPLVETIVFVNEERFRFHGEFADEAGRCHVPNLRQEAFEQWEGHELEKARRRQHGEPQPFSRFVPLPSPTIGRNDPCLCSSGRKFKRCCGG